MRASIEISLYPLKKDFIPPIDNFIESLKKYRNIEVRTNNMSTSLFGELDDLMNILKIEVETTFEKEVDAVFSLKILNGDSRKYDKI
tara:strand:- start:431 stop:691 length:261 start_codon:yes stop_codon:yes gene_type:complete